MSDAQFSPSAEEIVTSGTDGTTRVWNATYGYIETVLTGDHANVRSAQFNSDGTEILTSSLDGTVRIWRSLPREELLQVSTAETLTGYFDKSGHDIVAVTSSGRVDAWNVQTGVRTTVRSPGFNSQVLEAVISPNRDAIALARADGWISIVPFALNGSVENLHALYFNQVVWSARQALIIFDGNLASIWPLSDSSGALGRLISGGSRLTTALLSLDGTELVTADTVGVVRLWDARRMVELREFHDPANVGITTLSISPSGSTIASADSAGAVYLWNAATGRAENSINLPTGVSVSALAFSPDARELLTGSPDGVARIWSISRASVLAALSASTSLKTVPLTHVEFSPDGSEIATVAADGSVRVWSTEVAAPVRNLEAIAHRRLG
jgi:WD40 repeat protein